MPSSIVSHRGTALVNFESANAATSPSLFDASQFYDGGVFIGGNGAGNTFNVPAGLPRGWRTRIVAPLQGIGVTMAFDASYTTINAPGGVVAPYFVQPGGWCDIEVLSGSSIQLEYGAGSGVGSGMTAVATRAALKAIPASSRFNGLQVMILSDNSLWRFNSASAVNADGSDTLVIVPTAGTGRWIRVDKAFDLVLPFANNTADAAILFTCPAGFALRMQGLPYWDIQQSTAGNGALRLGASSSNLGTFTTKGDFLGGAAGNSQAQLTANSAVAGTVGTDFSAADTGNTSLAALQTVLLVSGSTIRFDIIAAGTDLVAGNVVFPVVQQIIGAVT